MLKIRFGQKSFPGSRPFPISELEGSWLVQKADGLVSVPYSSILFRFISTFTYSNSILLILVLSLSDYLVPVEPWSVFDKLYVTYSKPVEAVGHFWDVKSISEVL